MAHRLTEQEHDMVLELAKILSKQLPTQFRSVAGGIASGLVRVRKSPLPADAQEESTGVVISIPEGATEPVVKPLPPKEKP